MTKLNYSNLPPEVQKAIQKLTGYNHEELNGEVNKQPEPTTTSKTEKGDYTSRDVIAVVITLLVGASLLVLALYILETILTMGK